MILPEEMENSEVYLKEVNKLFYFNDTFYKFQISLEYWEINNKPI